MDDRPVLVVPSVPGMDAPANSPPACASAGEGARTPPHPRFKLPLGLCEHRIGQSKRGMRPSRPGCRIPRWHRLRPEQPQLLRASAGQSKALATPSPWHVPGAGRRGGSAGRAGACAQLLPGLDGFKEAAARQIP